MSALFDFMFGKLLGDAETALTVLKYWLIKGTCNILSRPSKLEC